VRDTGREEKGKENKVQWEHFSTDSCKFKSTAKITYVPNLNFTPEFSQNESF